jgi:hypothetical protein
MAYKIFTGAKPFLKADIKPFNITEIRMPACEHKNLTVRGEKTIIFPDVAEKH